MKHWFFGVKQKDSYTSTGCFDHTCSGFIQTGTQVVLGAAIRPLSSNSGQQYDMNVGIFKVVIIVLCVFGLCMRKSS